MTPIRPAPLDVTTRPQGGAAGVGGMGAEARATFFRNALAQAGAPPATAPQIPAVRPVPVRTVETPPDIGLRPGRLLDIRI